jgi:hypothetical protein
MSNLAPNHALNRTRGHIFSCSRASVAAGRLAWSRWASTKLGSGAMKTSAYFLIAWLSCLSATVIAAEPEYSKIKCMELGRKFSAEFKREYASDISIWGNPEFFYSSTLGTCLVFTEVIDGEMDKTIKSIWYYRRITDIYSNRVLAYSRYVIDKSDPTRKETLVNLRNVGDTMNLSPETFAAAKAKLFGN